MFAHLILDVSDLDRSLAFYAGLLHLRVRQADDWQGHRLAYLTTGKTEILLVQQPKEEQKEGFARAGGQVINLRVKDLSSMAAELERKNVPVLQSLDAPIYGERTFMVADPDGYPILLSEPVETLH